MNRPCSLLMAYGIVYGSLLVLFAFAIGDGDKSVGWAAWLVSSSLLLSSTALEATLVGFWLVRWCSGRLTEESWVPVTLSNEDRKELEESSPGVALLMPAHREVTTPEDAEAFTVRAVDIASRTPAYSTLFLLFDSPPEQHENELAVVEEIRRRLFESGRSLDAHRVQMEEYRNKPPGLRNKPGSIQMWIDRHSDRFGYLFVLDADSSLAMENPGRPQTCDVIARLVLAMERHSELGMIQTAIQVHTEPTLWGWVQRVGCGMASRYHGRLFQWLLDGTVPSYGHSVLFRRSDFVNHVKNTLDYLSHDFLDAADLATSGRKCIYTHAAVTCEEGESSLLGFLKRDLRWARGNAQWANYWFTKPGLPLGPRIFLAIGILSYVWPLLSALVLLTSVLLVGTGAELFGSASPWALQTLSACVLAALLVPKALSSRSLAEFNGSVVIGTLAAPALTLLQGVLFLLGAFGTKWTLRGSRSTRVDLEHVTGIIRLFFPVSLLGLALECFLLRGPTCTGLGALLLETHLFLMIASPIIAVALSLPRPGPTPGRRLPAQVRIHQSRPGSEAVLSRVEPGYGP